MPLSAPTVRLQALAEFRHQLRVFLRFSEEAAARYGLQPQQHQLLLQVAAVPKGERSSVRYVAERLGLRHNTVVELSKRSEDVGLLLREHDEEDRRRVLLRLTAKGRGVLETLSKDHEKELYDLAPQLIKALRKISGSARANSRPSSGVQRAG